MEKFELIIDVDLDMKKLTIRRGVYDCYEYECNNINEISEIIQDFTNEYIKGR